MATSRGRHRESFRHPLSGYDAPETVAVGYFVLRLLAEITDIGGASAEAEFVIP
jgi:hypothetical protein